VKNLAEWLAPHHLGKERPIAYAAPDEPVGARPAPIEDPARRLGHLLILGARMTGRPVFARDGGRIGRVLDVSIEKRTGQVAYVLVCAGGWLGLGGAVHPLPWEGLFYSVELGGYVAPYEFAELQSWCGHPRSDLECLGGGAGAIDRVLFESPYMGLPYL
jgi:hypothetical protein